MYKNFDECMRRFVGQSEEGWNFGVFKHCYPNKNSKIVFNAIRKAFNRKERTSIYDIEELDLNNVKHWKDDLKKSTKVKIYFIEISI